MTTEEQRDALQKAYNGVCSALSRLLEAGWADSTVASELEAIRVQLGKAAFPQ